MRNEELEVQLYTRRPLPTLRDAVAVLFRQRWTIVVTLCVVIVAATIAGVWTPEYDAAMKILVQHQRSDAIITSSTQAPVQMAERVTEEDINSEVELLSSEDLLRKVVLSSGLTQNFKSSAGANKSGTNTEENIERAVRKLSKDLRIQPLHKSNVILVLYSARDPRTAAKVLVDLAAAYKQKHLDIHHSDEELRFFDQQTEQYRKGLAQAQKQLTDFSKGTGVAPATVERDAALNQANEFDATARQAQTSVSETKKRIQALEDELKSTPQRLTTAVRSSDNPQLFQQLKGTLLNLELKRTELLTKYEPTYRLVQETDDQIAEAKAAISSEESKPMRDETTNRNPDYEWVQAELTKAHADLIALEARAAAAASIASQYHQSAQDLNRSGVTQQALELAAKTQEDNLILYTRKREEARISDALDQRGIVNVALAEQPVVPALPHRSLLASAILTILLAGFLSLSTAFAVDFMDPSFRTPDELASCLSVPVLAALPRSHGLDAESAGPLHALRDTA